MSGNSKFLLPLYFKIRGTDIFREYKSMPLLEIRRVQPIFIIFRFCMKTIRWMTMNNELNHIQIQFWLNSSAANCGQVASRPVSRRAAGRPGLPREQHRSGVEGSRWQCAGRPRRPQWAPRRRHPKWTRRPFHCEREQSSSWEHWL